MTENALPNPSVTLPLPLPSQPSPTDALARVSDTSAPVVALTRIAAVAALLGLIALGLAWELWLAPTGNRTLVLKVLPLLLPVVGLLKRRMYTYRWVSLMVWLYFTEGVVRGASSTGISGVLGWVEAALCVVLFAACAVHVRWRLAHKGAAPAAESTA